MNEKSSPIDRLPARIPGDGIEFVDVETESHPPWEEIRRWLGHANEAVMFRWADPLHPLKFREYSVINMASGQKVGEARVYPPAIDLENDEVIAIGGIAGEAFRNQGYATKALKALTEYVLDHDIASTVCAETKPYNAASIRVLTKAGFRRAGEGICSLTVVDLGMRVDRFYKSKNPHACWPLPN